MARTNQTRELVARQSFLIKSKNVNVKNSKEIFNEYLFSRLLDVASVKRCVKS